MSWKERRRPVHIEAAGFRGKTRSHCKGNKELLLFIHSQGPEGVNSLGPGAGQGWL